jgi:RHS repeat-associated protein
LANTLTCSTKKTDPALIALSLAMAATTPAATGLDGNLSTAAGKLSGKGKSLSGLLIGKESRNDAPPAYLNYLFFDKEMNYKYGGYTQMTEAAYEDGSNREHERLFQEVVAEEPGYFYIYLSNDGTEGGEAYFDDFSILTLESYIVQQTDYYPYGLVARNFVRAGEKETLELFQGKTYDELTGWYDFHARQYDAAVGRWFGVDPQDQFTSPYLAMGNNPVMMVDPDGELAWFVPIIIGAVVGGTAGGVIAHNNGQDWWKGAIVGGLIGAAVGTGVSAAVGAKGGITGMSTALGGSTKGWTIASNSFFAANYQMANAALNQGNLDEIYKSGLHGLGGGFSSSLIDISPLTTKVFKGHHSIKHLIRSSAYQIGGNLTSGNRIFENIDFGLSASLVFPAFQDAMAISSSLWSPKLVKKFIEDQKNYYLSEYGIKGGEKISTIVERSKFDLFTHSSGKIAVNFDLNFKMESFVQLSLPFLKSRVMPFNPSFSTKGSNFPLLGNFNYHLLSTSYLSLFNHRK